MLAIATLGLVIASSLTALAATGPQIDFAATEIAEAAKTAKTTAPAVVFAIDPALGAQSYQITPNQSGAIAVTGGDATGALYGGLDVAEAIRLGTLANLATGIHQPHIANRGIKFNIPLDLRTPSYSDSSDAAQANIPVMWEREFWSAFLDNMARHRYNVLSLWSLHPFPSLVKVPEFPDVALNDVWRTTVKLDGDFGGTGHNMVKPEMLASYEVVKKISIDEKIEFWRWVMRYAKDRGIDIYIFTWNVFTWGAEGKHGITRGMESDVTKQYFRASIREVIKTYPLLAGLGITAGEAMPNKMDPKIKEQWLWDTYGEGVRDALKAEPNRTVRLIHRFHWTAQKDIIDAWKNYPGFPATFDFSFKYSVAHMYSSTNPPFANELLTHLAPGMKTWLTVRNDDIYSFRWGDPAYARDYIVNMPAADKCPGFYMGPDGYTWGRSFLERNPAPGPRPLVIEKQWYSFMLWGRLAYDPTLPDSHFENVLAARFPGAPAPTLFAASAAASKIFPQITRFFWGDIDERWFPEASLSRPRVKGYYNIRHFVENTCMPGTGILNIREWREKLAAGKPMGALTPLQVADALRGYAVETQRLVAELRALPAATTNPELAATLDDYECFAHLGHYYADKVFAAAALGQYDLSGRSAEKATAIRHLEAALAHWKSYARVRDARYVPALYNRVEWVDITALTEKVATDIELAKAWQPGTVKSDSPRAKTEQGFK